MKQNRELVMTRWTLQCYFPWLTQAERDDLWEKAELCDGMSSRRNIRWMVDVEEEPND